MTDQLEAISGDELNRRMDLAANNPVYNELRQIYCVKGAEFCRPTLQKAWLEIMRLITELEAAQNKIIALQIEVARLQVRPMVLKERECER